MCLQADKGAMIIHKGLSFKISFSASPFFTNLEPFLSQLIHQILEHFDRKSIGSHFERLVPSWNEKQSSFSLTLSTNQSFIFYTLLWIVQHSTMTLC